MSPTMVEAPLPHSVRVAIMCHSATANIVLRYCLGRQPDLELVDFRLRSFVHQIDVLVVHALLSRRLRDAVVAMVSGATDTKLVLLGAPSDPQRLATFLQQGFDGYVKSGEPYDVLVDEIRRAAQGKVRFEKDVLEVMLETIRADRPDQTGQFIR